MHLVFLPGFIFEDAVFVKAQTGRRNRHQSTKSHKSPSRNPIELHSPVRICQHWACLILRLRPLREEETLILTEAEEDGAAEAEEVTEGDRGGDEDLGEEATIITRPAALQSRQIQLSHQHRLRPERQLRLRYQNRDPKPKVRIVMSLTEMELSRNGHVVE